MTTLILAPHPDDEVLGCTAELAGRAAVVAHVTDGVPPRHADSATVTAATRRAESAAAARVLDADVTWRRLGFADLQAWRAVHDVAAAIVGLLDELAPDEVVVPAYQRAHPDHDAVFVAALLARATHPTGPATRWRVAAVYGLDVHGRLRFDDLDADYFDRATRLGLDGAALARKAEALRCVASQLRPGSVLQRWLDAPVDEVRADLPPRSRPLPDRPSGYEAVVRLAERSGVPPSRVDTVLRTAMSTSPTALWRHERGHPPRPSAATH